VDQEHDLQMEQGERELVREAFSLGDNLGDELLNHNGALRSSVRSRMGNNIATENQTGARPLALLPHPTVIKKKLRQNLHLER
jgi:hypothetical protein